VNTYRTSDLRRPRARQGNHRHDHRRALALTRSGAGVDIPGVRRDMSDDERGRDRASSFLLPVEVSAAALTALKPAVKTATLLEPGALGTFLPQPCSSTAGSSATRTFLATFGASSRPSASSTAGY
jgi:hypothetical protein